MNFKLLKQNRLTPFSLTLGVALGLLSFIPNNYASHFDQNLQWEQQSNYPQSQKSEEALEMTLVPYERGEVNISAVKKSELSQDLQSVLNLFINKDTIYFPIHPRNLSHNIPWVKKKHQLPAIAKQELKKVDVLETSTRTLYLRDNHLISIETPTDREMNRLGEIVNENSHIDLYDSINRSRKISRFISLVDRNLQNDPQIIMIKDLAWIKLKRETHWSKNGFILRDVSILSNDNYYLPAFAIPYAGNEVAQKNQKDRVDFWGQAFAYNLGRFKAKLLLRYGLQMISPNPQSLLVELNPDFKPTGAMVFRGAENLYTIPAIAEKIVSIHKISDKKLPRFRSGKSPFNFIRPFWSNSCVDFNRSDVVETRFDYKTLSVNWFEKHRQGFLDEINQSLKTDFVPLNDSEMKEKHIKKYIKMVEKFQKYPGIKEEARYTWPILEFLQSQLGIERLTEYHQSLKTI